MNKPERIGKWNLWSIKPPTKIGWYWLAGYFPENRKEGTSESSKPEEVTMWEFSADNFDNPHNLLDENTIWFGPVHPPKFWEEPSVFDFIRKHK